MKKMFIYKSINGDTLGNRTDITSKSGMYAIAADLIARPEIDCVYCSSQQDKRDLVSVINDVNANGLSEMSYSSHNINVNIVCDESIFKDTESKKIDYVVKDTDESYKKLPEWKIKEQERQALFKQNRPEIIKNYIQKGQKILKEEAWKEWEKWVKNGIQSTGGEYIYSLALTSLRSLRRGTSYEDMDEKLNNKTDREYYSVLGIVDKFMDYIKYPERKQIKENDEPIPLEDNVFNDYRVTLDPEIDIKALQEEIDAIDEEKDDIECSTAPINKDYEIGDE